jgi:alkylation response protein AidB-like acyl-CoA dehydrogenase
MFELTREQIDIRGAAREFAEGEFVDIASECDLEETFPVNLWKKACDLGFIGIFIEEQFNGAGLGLLEYAIILEEFWRVDPGCGNILLATLGAEFIQEYGNDAQKERYLSPLTTGNAIIGTVADHTSILNSYYYIKNSRNDYIVDGSSKFVFNGTIANYLIITGQRPSKDPRAVRTFTTFIVEKGQKGVKARSLSDKLGIRASDISEIMLEDVSIPAQNVVGAEGEGLNHIGTFLDRLNVYASAQAIGASQGCLEKAVRYSRQRVQFGRPIGWFQVNQFKIADMATMIEAARIICHKAAWEYDRGGKDRTISSMAIVLSREVAAYVTGESLQIHGGYGYMKDLDIERFFRDVQFLELLGNSREGVKMLIAQNLLGNIQ